MHQTVLHGWYMAQNWLEQMPRNPVSQAKMRIADFGKAKTSKVLFWLSVRRRFTNDMAALFGFW